MNMYTPDTRAIHFIAASLRRAPMFEGLDEHELQALAEVFTPCTLARGQYLFRQGAPGNFMALLSAGALGVKIEGSPTDNRYGATLDPCEIIGEMTCLDPSPRSASVVAITNSEVLTLDRASIDRLRAIMPRIYSALLRCIRARTATRLRVTNEAIGLYGRPDGVVSFGNGDPTTRPAPYEGPVRLSDHEGLRHFNRAELEQLCDLARKMTYPQGAVICREGDEATHCYIVAKGDVVVCRELGRSRYELGRIQRGELFGQLALLERRRRSAMIEALSEAILVEIDREEFARLMVNHTPFGLRFQELVTVTSIRQLRSANERYCR